MNQSKEFKLMEAFIDSQISEDLDFLIEWLELSLEADRCLCELTEQTMTMDELCNKKLRQARLQNLILKLK